MVVVGERTRPAAHGLGELPVVPPHSRNGLRNVARRGVVLVAHELLVAVHLDLAVPPDALLAHDRGAAHPLKPAVGEPAACLGIRRRVAVVPVDRDGILLLCAAHEDLHGRRAGIRLGERLRGLDRLNAERLAHVEPAPEEAHRVAADVAERARAEVEPAAPLEAVVDAALERTHWGHAEPHVPIEIRRNDVAAFGPVEPLRPDRTVRRNVNLADVAEHAALQYLDAAALAVGAVAVVAHLRHHSARLRHVAETLGLPPCAHERFLNVHVEAALHRRDCADGVHVVGNGDDHRV